MHVNYTGLNEPLDIRLVQTDCIKHSKIEDSLSGRILCMQLISAYPTAFMQSERGLNEPLELLFEVSQRYRICVAVCPRRRCWPRRSDWPTSMLKSKATSSGRRLDDQRRLLTSFDLTFDSTLERKIFLHSFCMFFIVLKIDTNV